MKRQSYLLVEIVIIINEMSNPVSLFTRCSKLFSIYLVEDEFIAPLTSSILQSFKILNTTFTDGIFNQDINRLMDFMIDQFKVRLRHQNPINEKNHNSVSVHQGFFLSFFLSTSSGNEQEFLSFPTEGLRDFKKGNTRGV